MLSFVFMTSTILHYWFIISFIFILAMWCTYPHMYITLWISVFSWWTFYDSFSNVILYILRYALIKRHISVSTTEMTIASQFDSAKIYMFIFSILLVISVQVKLHILTFRQQAYPVFSLIDCFTWNILYIVNITNYLSYDFITIFVLNE